MTSGRRAGDDAIDPSLQRELDALAPPGLLIGHRRISPGDEEALLERRRPRSRRPSSSRAARQRCRAHRGASASGAAWTCARAAVPKGASGEPIWPAGIAGSLAHDDKIAVAAVGRLGATSALSVIDIEPAVLLPPDMLELIATPAGTAQDCRRSVARKASLRRQGGGLQGGLSARSRVSRISRHRGRPRRAQGRDANRARRSRCATASRLTWWCWRWPERHRSCERRPGR